MMTSVSVSTLNPDITKEHGHAYVYGDDGKHDPDKGAVQNVPVTQELIHAVEGDGAAGDNGAALCQAGWVQHD